MPGWLAEVEGGVRISVRVTPRAGRNALDGERDGRLLVRVTAAPEDGKANAAVCKLLAKRLGIGKSRVSVVFGETARAKVIEAEGVSLEGAADALAA
jgi:uncharacterized protein (TIGR00251 family)